MDEHKPRPGTHDEDGKPLGEHLEELRWTVLRSLIALFIGVAVCFLIFDKLLIEAVLAPLHMDSLVLGRPPQFPDGSPIKLLTIHVLDRFKMIMIAALVGGALLTSPYIVWEFWKFISVGLFPNEKRLFFLVLPAFVGFFSAGVAFGYFVLLPVAIDFLLSFGGTELPVNSQLIVGDYLTYFFALTFMLGLVFQIPLVITAVARVTDVSPEIIAKYRRHIIVISLVVGMIMTPPDPFTQLLVAGPIVLLFELGLIMGRFAHRARLREHEEAMAGPDPWAEILDGEPAPGSESATASAKPPIPPETGGSSDGNGKPPEPPPAAPGPKPGGAGNFVVGETPFIDHWRDADTKPAPPAEPIAEPTPEPVPESPTMVFDSDSDRVPVIRPPAQSVARKPKSPPPAEPPAERISEPSPEPPAEPSLMPESAPDGEMGPFHRPMPSDGPPEPAPDGPRMVSELDVIEMIDARLRHFVVDELPLIVAEELRRQLEDREHFRHESGTDDRTGGGENPPAE